MKKKKGKITNGNTENKKSYDHMYGQEIYRPATAEDLEEKIKRLKKEAVDSIGDCDEFVVFAYFKDYEGKPGIVQTTYTKTQPGYSTIAINMLNFIETAIISAYQTTKGLLDKIYGENKDPQFSTAQNKNDSAN